MSAIAYLSQGLSSTAPRFRLLPAGVFRATDGRPQNLSGWILDDQDARRIMAAVHSSSDDFVIDYEHQSLNTKDRAAPSPAAGWFRRLEWIAGDGMYVVDARWTAKAVGMVQGQEYRYISPVFRFDTNSGHVLALISAALTNRPALAGLTDLAACGQSQNPTAYAGILSEDTAKLQHVFGPDFMTAPWKTHEGEDPSGLGRSSAQLAERDQQILDAVFAPYRR